MNLFHRKSKKEKNNFISDKQIIKEFDSYFKLYHEDDYKNILNSYNHIKTEYKSKMENKEIDITIEKIRLEKNIGKFQGTSTKNGNTIITAMFCVFAQFTVIDGIKLVSIKNSIIIYLLTYLALFLFLYYMSKDINKTKPNDLMIYISLKALEDLEKEYDDENTKKQDIKNQQAMVEQLKSENIDSKKDVFMDIVAPAILEVAASVVQKNSLVKKIFKKKK
ncbi:hypothetical protein [Clostridium tunisiense]|uniref:hypothetical protein n=1 Tax=Clostridium tunisiense TaxID=219748 RepID=UPI0002F089FE|nr:hypothetical protein [Clostridium tunisiense]